MGGIPPITAGGCRDRVSPLWSHPVNILKSLLTVGLSGLFFYWSLKWIKLLTTPMSIRWKKGVFHHLVHLRCTLWVASIWSDRSTAFIYWLYIAKTWGWRTSTVFHTPFLFFTLRFTWTESLALPVVVIAVTTLLSTHCKTRQGGSLCHRIVPLALFFPHSVPFLKSSSISFLFCKMVPVAITPC